jgi:hypothetical protein
MLMMTTAALAKPNPQPNDRPRRKVSQKQLDAMAKHAKRDTVSWQHLLTGLWLSGLRFSEAVVACGCGLRLWLAVVACGCGLRLWLAVVACGCGLRFSEAALLSWDNCRSSRVTELIRERPIQDVADWMGHGVETLLKHYAQIVKQQRASASRGVSVLGASRANRRKRSKRRSSH